ncbi:unnamed protein product [Nyctereutes procyonoides]|uniref:dihydrofolate reductase n=1 Tax=Nyctereutes procyonoides TaxID=34880 RepID=A0A811Y0H7_NYCPR|nr:unnamed protein product [Nyctereutes procyonoides]
MTTTSVEGNRIFSQEKTQGTSIRSLFSRQSLDYALKLINQPELTKKVDMVWIVGDSSVYKEATNKPGHLKLLVTGITQAFENNTFLPENDLEIYKLLPEYPSILSDVQEEKSIK